MRNAAWRLLHPDIRDEFLKEVAVFGAVNIVGRSTHDGRPRLLEPLGEIERSLPAILHDNTIALLAVIDFHHILKCEGFKVEAVRCIVVRRHRLRIRVDHHDFITTALKRKCRVATAPVKFDALANAVWTAPEHHNLLLIVRDRVGDGRRFPSVGAIEVRRNRLKFTRARIDGTELGAQALGKTLGTNRVLSLPRGFRNFLIREAHNFRLLKDIRWEVFARESSEEDLECREFREFALEPRVISGRIVVAEGRFEGAHRLEVGLLKGAPNRHDFAHRLHLRTKGNICARELLKGEARHFNDDIVERGFKCRGGLAGNVVREFIERITDCQKRGNFRDGEACRLRGECRRARNTRIHLDDNAPPRAWVDRPLHIRPACRNTNLLKYANRVVAHFLIFAVRQRLNRRNGNGVARMHAHRVHILDGADNDGIARLVAHDFHLKLFPANERLLNQDFAIKGSFQATRANRVKLLGRMGDTTTCAAKGEARTDD